MNTQFVVAAILLQAVRADFVGDANSVSSAADVLASSISSWNSGSGLQGALGIQGYFPTLSSAVASLSSQAGSVDDSDIDVSSVNSFGSAVISLLNAMTAKAGDFQAVGAGAIVSNDLKDLTGPAGAIVSDIVKAITSDCSKINSLTDVFGGLQEGFSSAAASYSVDAPSFPSPSCAGGGSGVAGAAGSSSASKSASSSSHPSSSFVSSSVASSSAESSSNASSSKASSSSSIGTSSGKTPSGVGAAATSGGSSTASSSGSASTPSSSSSTADSSASSSSNSKNGASSISGYISGTFLGAIAMLI